MLTAAPVGAAEVPVATEGASGLLPSVPGARLASAGAKGFLTYVPYDGEDGRLRWTPYEGGAARDLSYHVIDGTVRTSGEMAVTSSEIYGTSATDMSTGTSFGIEKRAIDDGIDVLDAGTAGQALFARGTAHLWLQTKDAEPRAVQGLDGADTGRVWPGDATHGLVDTSAGGESRIGLIDLTSATLTYPYPAHARNPVISGNRLAWVEDDTAANAVRAVVRDRTTGAETVVPVPGTTAGQELRIDLLGDWVTHGGTALHTRTGEKLTFLDRVHGTSATPDGSALIVQGAGTAEGEGIFRVTPGADGRPTVRLLAHAGTPTSALHDFDNDGLADLLGRDASGALWRDSAKDGQPRSRIGGGWQIYDKIETVGDIAGRTGPGFTPELLARDKSGVLWLYEGRVYGGFGERLRVGAGWQTYATITGGSDLTGDGRPDVVAVDRAGALWLYRSTGDTFRPFEPRKRIGTGWNTYNQVVAVGDLAGGPAGDLVARDKEGVLWLYLGKGDGTYTQRTGIGGGWQAYSQLVGAGDVDHDGKADLFAHHPGSKTVYLYSGTGDRHKPFKARTVSDAHKGSTYNHMS
ncbi:VCBS repeat-containing protein [Streptomyces sp. Je 1-79]|uniref:FG-GAP repeat domain-containing protein n=1 Tax=Streptomyces sp. Je 1-79 TaxID=2943847 RepID=UPI0021A6B2C8|nr:VCBS repeat-containing protein [Streptomyces sp. Je 1-79]MCT4357238.1 VCBS repeat-containing protein [Streptomyces sp. Je 1-79]